MVPIYMNGLMLCKSYGILTIETSDCFFLPYQVEESSSGGFFDQVSALLGKMECLAQQNKINKFFSGSTQ